MPVRSVYLDHQASTPVLPEVFDAMKPYFSEAFGSASSLHQQGLRVRDALARAREQFAALVHADSPEDILFTSGGTESANLAVKGAAYASQRTGNHIITSTIEHPSVLNSIEFMEKQGFTATRIAVDSDGRINPEHVRAAITDKTILICIQQANHDIGTIEPVRELGAIAAGKGIPMFVDATLSGGWLPIDVREMGASLLSLSPHRFYGPKGVGVLYRHKRARLTSLIHGGVQEGGRRAGTENVPAIVGAGVAAEFVQKELAERMAWTARLQKKLWDGLRTNVPYIKLNGPEPGRERISTNLNLSIEFVEGEGVMLLCDVQGIAIASGTSCVSKAIKVSPVLAAIGLDHALAQGAVLLSLGKDNTDEQIDHVLQVLPKVVAKLRGMSPMWDEFERGMIKSAIGPAREGMQKGGETAR